MKKALWIRLKKYRFENLAPVSMKDLIIGAFGQTDAFTRAFAAKVARKHGWSNEFAFAAVREYKKFIFLGIISPHQVTPPKAIDQVWHEHLLFTGGYRDFCENVLRQNFDHAPELIPFDAQTSVFNAQYQATLALYEREFGIEPPDSIWGRPKFDPAAVVALDVRPRKKHEVQSASSSGDDTPLFVLFASPPDAPFAPIPFSGHGGSMGGGGTTRSWDDPVPSTAGHSDHSITADAGHASGCTTSGCSGGGCGGD